MRRRIVLAVSAFGLLLGCLAQLSSFDRQPPPGAEDGGGGELDGGEDAGHEEDSGNPSGLDERPANATCVAPERPVEHTSVTAVEAFPRLTFSQPLYLLHAPGEAQRLFVVERRGTVQAFGPAADAGTAVPFVDITARVNSGAGGEAGLLGMAFHPRWAENREVFLSYTGFGGTTNLRTVIARYKSNDNGQTLDPASEEVILTVDQPYSNHNGGGIQFGPDGFLYIGLGDGGSGGDPQRHGQNRSSLLGKFLRLDVDSATPYAIPADNPFRAGGGRPEIFALGFRNPWRWSFDRATGDLWVADVGQSQWEEVNRVVRGGNYGWNLREGAHCYGGGCDAGGLIDPVVEYDHREGVSVTGGYVYRGAAIPSLVGKFIYGDFGSGRVWAVSSDATTGRPVPEPLFRASAQLSSFGEGPDGELYLLDFGAGRVLKMVPANAPPPPLFPQRLSATGCVDPQNPTRPASGVIPYDLNAPLWSDAAGKERGLALPDGTKMRVTADGDFELPPGAVTMKTFFVGGKRVETRLFMRHPDGTWAGYSYEWDDAQTDAVLLPGSKTRQVGTQTWYFPSRAECIICHTSAAGRTLGLEAAQLDRRLRYPSTGRTRNQLVTLQAIGLFEAPLPAVPRLPAYDGPEPGADRARAYLHSNCSGCHRPGGNGQGAMDFRFATHLASAGVCNVPPSAGNLGNPVARILVPGRPADSLMSLRMHALDVYRMPPLGTRVVDPQGTALVDGWIASLGACP